MSNELNDMYPDEPVILGRTPNVEWILWGFRDRRKTEDCHRYFVVRVSGSITLRHGEIGPAVHSLLRQVDPSHHYEIRQTLSLRDDERQELARYDEAQTAEGWVNHIVAQHMESEERRTDAKREVRWSEEDIEDNIETTTLDSALNDLDAAEEDLINYLTR